jgi:hypothetical protein
MPECVSPAFLIHASCWDPPYYVCTISLLTSPPIFALSLSFTLLAIASAIPCSVDGNRVPEKTYHYICCPIYDVIECLF